MASWAVIDEHNIKFIICFIIMIKIEFTQSLILNQFHQYLAIINKIVIYFN